MGFTKGNDFFWSRAGEPHTQRRKEILAKYGAEVRKLYGYDNSTAVQVVLVTLCQFVMAYIVRDWGLGKLVLAGWVVGGTFNQNLLCAQHELSHFLACKRPVYNKFLSFLSNLVIAVPMAPSFRKYHQEHHSDLGVDGIDVDLPTFSEANYVSNLLFKVMFTSVYIAIYGLRPLIIRPKKAGKEEIVCTACVLTFDFLVFWFFGWKSLFYLLISNILGGGLHPLAGHLIAEHYMFLKGQETYSYYGPLNALTYNVGYHNEHHDFPQIPHTRLHKLRRIAPEFYENRYYHTSWTWVLWKFITDPDMGPWSRLRRTTREGKLDTMMGPRLVAK